MDGVTALPGFYQNSEKNAANAEANEPLRYTDRNGFTVRRCLPTIARSTSHT